MATSSQIPGMGAPWASRRVASPPDDGGRMRSRTSRIDAGRLQARPRASGVGVGVHSARDGLESIVDPHCAHLYWSGMRLVSQVGLPLTE